MVQYTCGRCGKIFNRKYVYEKHLNRVKPCEKIDLPEQKEETIVEPQINVQTQTEESEVSLQTQTEEPEVPLQRQTIEPNVSLQTSLPSNEDYPCEGCFKTFRHKSSLVRHQKNNCDKTRLLMGSLFDIKLKPLMEQIEQIKDMKQTQ